MNQYFFLWDQEAEWIWMHIFEATSQETREVKDWEINKVELTLRLKKLILFQKVSILNISTFSNQ